MESRSGDASVVVGVSDSPDSDNAVDWAAEWASLTGLSLTLMHVAGDVAVHPRTDDFLAAERAASQAGLAIVDAAARRAAAMHADLSTATVVEIGDPSAALIGHASHASLLVVGSRGRPSRRMLEGSVSHAVTRHAPCPVVVVREPPAQTALGRRVVLGVDGTPASRPGAEFAFRYAAFTGLPIAVVHASWDRLARGSAALSLLSSGDEHGPSDDEQLSIAETLAGLPERYPDVLHHDVHRSTDPAQALIDASKSAMLVVVGAHRRHPVAALLLRSVSASVVEHAHCPVAVVPMRRNED